jgi:hypothetical protein
MAACVLAGRSFFNYLLDICFLALSLKSSFLSGADQFLPREMMKRTAIESSSFTLADSWDSV